MLLNRFSWLFITLLIICAFSACDNSVEIPPQPVEQDSTASEVAMSQLSGTGSFVFDSYQPLSNKPIPVYYYVPTLVKRDAPILFVFHGGTRDALESRDKLVAKATALGMILVVPEFSQQHYPGGDQYNLGNVFVDGDSPSNVTLNIEPEWTFSAIAPLFNEIKSLTSNNSSTYNIFGFSAGAQFAHRLLFFKPQASINKIVLAASGWYTMPNDQVTFPYGIKESTIDIGDFNSIFQENITVLIGESDNNPNAGGLRRNNTVDTQGTNRLSRASYFYTESQRIANSLGYTFNWQYNSLPRTAHDFTAIADYAMDNLLNP